MQAIGAAVDNIHSLDENLAPLLIDLGKAHSTSGMFDPSYFELFKVSCLSLKKKTKPENGLHFLPLFSVSVCVWF